MAGNFVSLYKTRKRGEAPALKLKSSWISGELDILVIDGNIAWSGKFNADEIEGFCEDLGITKDEYITECQKAFSGVDNFLFAVENSRFVWRKELEADTRVKFGSIKLSSVPLVQALEQFVDFTFETVERCKQEVTDAKNKMRYFETERTGLVQKIEEYTKNKKEIENILYSKFLYVLNAKKERIASLEQELSDLKAKIQHNDNETESKKSDEIVVTERSSKTTEGRRKTNKKPYQHKVQQPPSSVAVDIKSQVLSDIPVENNDTQTTYSSTSNEVKHQRNVRQKSQQMAKIIPLVENSTTSCEKEESGSCTSKTFVEQKCEPDVLEHSGSTQHQPSKSDSVQQTSLVVRSTSPIASTSTSVIQLENHTPVKYETADQFVPEEQGTYIPSQPNADQKSPPLVKIDADDLMSEQINSDARSLYSSEPKRNTVRKISEVICPIDLMSQKIDAQSDVSHNNLSKCIVSKNNKKVVTSPAKQCKEFEIISPLDLLVQPKSLTPSPVHKDTVCMPETNSLKRPFQSINIQGNGSPEFSTDDANVCQEAVTCSAEGVNDANTNSGMNTADATTATVSSVNQTKSQNEGESNHYDSETDVDEPEDVCKLSDKHRSAYSILEDSNNSSLSASRNIEVNCDEVHQLEQKSAIEKLLNDSQDMDCASEEIPPKRTRRSERINKCVPMLNKSINHFTKLNHIRDNSQNVSQNMRSILHEQETQIVDTQKLLDELG